VLPSKASKEWTLGPEPILITSLYGEALCITLAIHGQFTPFLAKH
jgi:hypothetical protein